MEVLLKKLDSFPSKLRDSMLEEMRSLVDDIMKTYEIKYKHSEKCVNKNELYEMVFSRFNVKQDSTCKAVSKNGNPCIRKSMPGVNYCKIHVGHLICNSRTQIENHVEYIVESNVSNVTPKEKKDLKKVFIDNSFYLTDETFVYDKNDVSKVGYVTKENGSIDYVLTDDPFILDANT